MKITYIHQHFKLPNEGGGSRPFEFAKRMVNDGHEVTMICGGKTPLDSVINGVHIVRLEVPYANAMSISQRIRSFLQFMYKSSIVAARTQTDVIFASSTPLTVAVPGIVGKIFRRVPLVFEVRDLWPAVPIELGYLKNPVFIRLAKGLEKLTYNLSSQIIALSPGMKDGILEVSPNKPVTVVPNASDFEMFSKTKAEIEAFRNSQGWSPDETIIVYAGGFGPTYQLSWVVKLAAAMQKSDARFILLGEGRDSDELKALAESLGLDSSKLLLGNQSKKAVSNFVASADLVMSSLSEDECLEVNSLNKVFDGLAASRPILFNHAGWLQETVVNAKAGWQLDRAIEIAVQQLLKIMSDKVSISEASKNSAILGHERFDRDKLYQELISVLESAVK